MDVIIKGVPDDFEVTIGSSDWGKNLAASVITGTLTFGLGWVWAGASALTYKVFEDKLWGYINSQIQLLSTSLALTPFLNARSPATMFCRQCGAEIPVGSVFCERCGTKLA